MILKLGSTLLTTRLIILSRYLPTLLWPSPFRRKQKTIKPKAYFSKYHNSEGKKFWTLFEKCSYFVLMRNIDAQTRNTPSPRGVASKLLSSLPEARVVLSCCQGEVCVDSSGLLKAMGHLTVAEVINRMRCDRCGAPPLAAHIELDNRPLSDKKRF